MNVCYHLDQQPDFATIVHALAYHAGLPVRESKTLSYIINKELHTKSISFNDLFLLSKTRAQALLAHKTSLVIVLMPGGFDFVQALIACWLAGVIPVSCPIPQRQSQLVRLQQIAKETGIKKILIQQSVYDRLLKKIPSFDQGLFEIIEWEAITADTNPVSGDCPFPQSNDLALIQYTSGSTGNPKGIMITHANLIANSRMIQQAFGLGPEDRSLSWLPHYHDMGLVEGLLQPMYTGFNATLMSPQLFLAAPECWFRAIHHFGITYSGGPNFAYEHAVRRVDTALVASSPAQKLRLVYNGAEPIAEKTLRAFSDKFGFLGYTWPKLVTCYGLAEATLAVTVSDRQSGPLVLTAGQRTLVSSGSPVAGTTLRIRTDEGHPAAEGTIGEILIQSPSVSSGYYRKPLETRQTFVELSEESPSSGAWLRTGDLGFLHQGQLFITGRKKDLIILNGQNIYPQDLEECASEIAPGRSVAFQLDTEPAKLVLISEVPRHRPRSEYENITLNIKQAMFRDHGILPGVLLLVPKGNLQVTSSGKICRQFNKEKFNKGEFDQIYNC